MSSPEQRPEPARTRKPRSENPSATRTLLRASGVLALLLVVVYVAVTSYSGVPGRSYNTVYVSVPQTGNLILHDQVRIGGVRVGQVLGTTVDDSGNARVELQLDKDTRLTRDTAVAIRANGLLGARYVELKPGRSRQTLAAGATIRGGADSLSFGVSEALNTFDKETQGALGTMVRGLGTGLLGRGQQLNDTIRVARDAMPRFKLLADTALARTGAPRRLLPSLEQGMTPLDENRRAITALFGPASDALAPLVDQRSAVQDLLDQAPSTLTVADSGLQAGVPLLAAARAVAKSADRTLPYAPAALRATTRLLRTSDKPLDRAGTLLDEVGPTVPAVLKITRSLKPVLPRLQDLLDETSPVLTKVAPHACDIINFATIFRSMTGFGGGGGEGPNGPAMAFRLQVIAPAVGEALRIPDPAGMVRRDGYPAPCKYLSKPYASATIVRVP
jgi:virulence factor Mce-like protein